MKIPQAEKYECPFKKYFNPLCLLGTFLSGQFTVLHNIMTDGWYVFHFKVRGKSETFFDKISLVP